jgi:hypothetical protein
MFLGRRVAAIVREVPKLTKDVVIEHAYEFGFAKKPTTSPADCAN